MISDIKAKKDNMVITKDLSRLGRDYIMTSRYMERYFPEKRVRYISLQDGMDMGVESTVNEITASCAIMNDMYPKIFPRRLRVSSGISGGKGSLLVESQCRTTRCTRRRKTRSSL